MDWIIELFVWLVYDVRFVGCFGFKYWCFEFDVGYGRYYWFLGSDYIFWDYEGFKFWGIKIGYFRRLGLNIEILDWLKTYENYVIIFIGDDL